MLFRSSRQLLAAICTSLALTEALPHQEPQYFQIGSRTQRRDNAAISRTDYANYAVAGINQMQTWYDAATGLYARNWWPSANVVTMLADFHDYFPASAKPVTDLVFPTSLQKAPLTFPKFLNGYYDDELWWALAWIKVYDVTKNQTYLNTAAEIFEDAKAAWGSSPCGGLWWDKAHTQVGAVENELYLTTAIKLANRRPTTPAPGYYFNAAMAAYDWFVHKSTLINAKNTINNGLNLATCKNDGNYVFSYNQGIILSALVELTWATADSTYNNLAHTLAKAAIAALTDANGILHEPCEPGACNADEEQFKGIFARNIQFLYNRGNVLPEDAKILYRTFLQKNANAIWAFDRAENQLGLVWSGPSGRASVQTQSSALDALVGAAAVS